MSKSVIDLAYLAAAVLFIVGLKGLTRPRTAVRGNGLAAVGMLLAIGMAMTTTGRVTPVAIAGLVVGTLIGVAMAYKVKMTAMPELVALLNGFGGGASALVGCAAVMTVDVRGMSEIQTYIFLSATVASGVSGAFTFSGSLVAMLKLQEMLSDRFMRFAGANLFNGLLKAATVGLGVWNVLTPENMAPFWASMAVATLMGLTVVVRIGAADMPVVISLLNACSGVAAAFTGFVLGNSVLIVSGSLVGSSGVILTFVMCRGMNRTLGNVLFSGVGSGAMDKKAEEAIYAGKVKSSSPEEVAMMLEVAQRVVIVPGYGLAQAQAQHAVRDLFNLLLARGVDVEFGIHPVAGRMPGHMNVLLAEANIPYDRVKEMDEINASFESTDVVLVIGANDVVNPMARTDPKCPIAGMPILNVDFARTVVVVKRSLSPGFAKIPNPLFAADNCLMLFGDGRKAILDLITALKETD